MLDKDILCATDLTPVSDKAVQAAQAIAERIAAGVTLMHVMERKEQQEPVLAEMAQQVQRTGATVHIEHKLLDGDLMKRMAEETEHGHSLLVLGTHGPRGLRQNLFGADILKLVRHAAIPTLVVQEGMNLPSLLNRIVMPVAGHADIDGLLDIVVGLAKVFAADVHVYQLARPGETASPELLTNKQRMLERLLAEGVRHEEVNEPSTVFSVGFADATIRYASRVGAGAIAIMSHASDEYRYIADAEKERILMNDARIPVICA